MLNNVFDECSCRARGLFKCTDKLKVTWVYTGNFVNSFQIFFVNKSQIVEYGSRLSVA